MATQIIDSDRRCPYDGKRMLLELGQDDTSGDHNAGVLRQWHECWSCGYRERDDQWPRQDILELVSGETAEQREQRLRLEGWELRLLPDTGAPDAA